jgi:NAD(P)-dependent dehydrogenase (short-subunit alcohol dehydrogenase family)
MTSETCSKVWFVTGASRGLGRVIVEQALSAGHKVIAGARIISPKDDLLEKYGSDRYLAIELDVTKSTQITAAVEAAISIFGSVDVFVNNAGYSTIQSIEETSMDVFREQLEVNLFGVIACTKAILPCMRKSRKGHIIQISSVAGQLGPPGRGPYAAAKWGVEGFSEVLSAEVAPLGISVTIAEPGGFRTGFADTVNVNDAEKVLDDYKSTVGKMIQFQSDYAGNQPGDPIKAAKALLLISGMENPPLRIALGSDAYDAFEFKQKQKKDERRHFEALSRSLIFENGQDKDVSSAWKKVIS